MPAFASSGGWLISFSLGRTHVSTAQYSNELVLPLRDRFEDRGIGRWLDDRHWRLGGQPGTASRDDGDDAAEPPGFTLRGGTNEILRGAIARGLGLR